MTPTQYWKPTPKVYEQIQKLKQFVHQVSHHELATEQDKQNADKVISLLETIDQPETYKEDWYVELWIIDEAVQSGAVKEGVHLRKWSIFFEQNTLHVEAETCHTSDHQGHYGDEFSFYGMISLELVSKGKQVYLYKDVEEFVQDAANYKSHITDTLNEVEMEISV